MKIDISKIELNKEFQEIIERAKEANGFKLVPLHEGIFKTV